MNNLDKTLLFVSSTKRNDLCCLSANINPEEQHDISAKSDFHWQILKCRQIIFKNDQIIASPTLGNQIQIQIVLSKQLYGTGVIQELLEKLKMPGHRHQPLTNSIYESCLRYTILAHIAPQWNQVQNYLVQGRQFLEANGPLSAIKLELEVKEESMYVVLSPIKVSVPRLKLDDLDIPPALSQKFSFQPNSCINDINMGAKWVHVLPSMKRGRIITISNRIPKSCPYPTYKDLRRHWKNSYGYRLPESEEGMFYCTISFHPLIPTKYTYPSICLRSAPLQSMGRSEERKIVAAFLSDLAKKFSSACGQPFKINGELGYTIPKSMEQIRENIRPSATLLESHTGLLLKPVPSATAGFGILTAQNMNCCLSGDADMFPTQNSGGVSLTTPLSVKENMKQLHNNIPLQNEGGAQSQAGLPYKISEIVKSQQNGSMSAKQPDNFANVANAVFIKPSKKQITPNILRRQSQTFTESAFASNTSQLASTPGQHPAEIIEPAHAAVPWSFPTHHVSTTSSRNPTPTVAGASSMASQQVIQNTISCQLSKQPASSTQQMMSAAPIQGTAGVLETATIAPNKYKPIFAPPAVAISQSLQIGKSAAKSTPLHAGMGSACIPIIQGAAQKISASTGHIATAPKFGAQIQQKTQNITASRFPTFGIPPNASSTANTKVPAFGNNLPLNLSRSASPKLPAFGNQVGTNALPMTPKKKIPPASDTQIKRIADNSSCQESSPGNKKPRTRPKVQVDVDIETTVRSQGLEKVNAATLINWLRQRSVPCTLRDSKQALISKVESHLALNKN